MFSLELVFRQLNYFISAKLSLSTRCQHQCHDCLTIALILIVRWVIYCTNDNVRDDHAAWTTPDGQRKLKCENTRYIRLVKTPRGEINYL